MLLKLSNFQILKNPKILNKKILFYFINYGFIIIPTLKNKLFSR